MKTKPKLLAVDFDGTCAVSRFPKIGEPVHLAIESLRFLKERGWKLILWTVRSGQTLVEAMQWASDRGVEFDSANVNPNQGRWSSSQKAYAPFYVDDSALGCPLLEVGKDVMVDWYSIMEILNIHYPEERIGAWLTKKIIVKSNE